VLARPFDDEAKGPRRESSGQHIEALDVDRRLIATVARMKMRASEMLDLVVVHPDHDPVEGTDSRHGRESTRACRRYRGADIRMPAESRSSERLSGAG